MLKESIDNNRAWAIKEIRDGSDWWMIRGGAFSNKTNNKYPKRLFKEKGDAELFSNNLNREGNWKTKIVEVWNFKKDKDNSRLMELEMALMHLMNVVANQDEELPSFIENFDKAKKLTGDEEVMNSIFSSKEKAEA